MRAAAFIVPAPLHAITGGSIYDRRIIDGLRARGWAIDVIELEGSFPRPSATALTAAEQSLARIPYGGIVIVDGLVFGVMPDVAERHRERHHFVALVHLPLALEEGLDASEARRLESSERRALASARHVIVTGPAVVDILEQYGVERSRISVVEPGCDAAALPAYVASTSRKSVHLLCVANVTPGKGYEDLIHALAGLTHLEWTLTVAGDLGREPVTTERCRRLIDEAGVTRRITMAGVLSGPALHAAYAEADAFVLATRRETYGMAVAEAVAHGLPVVSTTTGEIPRLVGSDAGLLCAPGDVNGLREALVRVITDPILRSKLRNGALAAKTRLRTWDEAADRFQDSVLRSWS